MGHKRKEYYIEYSITNIKTGKITYYEEEEFPASSEKNVLELLYSYNDTDPTNPIKIEIINIYEIN